MVAQAIFKGKIGIAVAMGLAVVCAGAYVYDEFTTPRMAPFAMWRARVGQAPTVSRQEVSLFPAWGAGNAFHD